MKKKKVERHNFNKGIALHLVCSTDQLRVVMQCIYFKDGYAYASNGHVLIKANMSEISSFSDAEISNLDGKFLHGDSFKEIVKCDVAKISDDGFICSNSHSETLYKFVMHEKYPNADKIFADHKNNALNKICVNPLLLYLLQKAVNSSTVILEFDQDYLAVLVRFVNQESGGYMKSIGLLMPLLDPGD
ncbi:hypothetical protein [Bacteroides reticulotermitis]|uniref:Uncharacterized protein n=2 Tax=Bacteroides reticulotermitis TaxID=1133319 RepID=W4UQB4_9BACE|nr:hypothetical protein [Bacteroides reticulotermitis]MBB4043859.1 hypothetical protein [Bacteroides reticulotermitis]GAE83370.1 hypothetical protein JCM10512_1638 [Bacteroides reticulotermitis JCM 10512]